MDKKRKYVITTYNRFLHLQEKDSESAAKGEQSSGIQINQCGAIQEDQFSANQADQHGAVQTNQCSAVHTAKSGSVQANQHGTIHVDHMV